MSLVHIRYFGRGYVCGLEPNTQWPRKASWNTRRIPTCIACIARAPEVVRRFKEDAIHVRNPTIQPIFEEVL